MRHSKANQLEFSTDQEKLQRIKKIHDSSSKVLQTMNGPEGWNRSARP